MTLTCPKCQGDMRTYERNSVHVDQCTECRGIFLDRGELEKLIDAETSWHGGQPAAARQAPPAAATAQPPAAAGGLGAIVGEVLQQAKAAKTASSGYDRYPSGYGQGYPGSPEQRPRSKKKSFLDELFG